MSARARYKCESKGVGGMVVLTPVDGPENKLFFDQSGGHAIQLEHVGLGGKLFTQGEEYFVDFTLIKSIPPVNVK